MKKTQNILTKSFFNRDSCEVAIDLLGKVIRKKHNSVWLSAQIIETEAYYKSEKGSHASLGFTENRKALFMPPGTIYMYYSRGKDSLNFSCKGDGNALLIKSGIPYFDNNISNEIIRIMQKNNPSSVGKPPRIPMKLCSGQTLLCKSLGILVIDWNQKQFDPNQFYIEDVDKRPNQIIQTKRLGIPVGRDEHLPFRFIDLEYAKYCTKNPLTVRKNIPGKDYIIKNL